MDIFKAIEARRTVRKYQDIPVEWEKIGNLLMGAHYAPSAGNIQNWRFLVVTDKDSRRAISEACFKQFWMEDAYVHIVVGSDPHEMVRQYDEKGDIYDWQSCSAAIQNILLLAEEQGLCAAWIGAFDEQLLKDAVGMPGNVRPHAVITVGYSDDTPPMPEKFHISDIVYINRWGNKIENMDAVMNDWSEVIRKRAKGALKDGEMKARPLFDKGRAKAKELKEKLGRKLKK